MGRYPRGFGEATHLLGDVLAALHVCGKFGWVIRCCSKDACRYAVEWASGLVMIEQEALANRAEYGAHPIVPAHKDVLASHAPRAFEAVVH